MRGRLRRPTGTSGGYLICDGAPALLSVLTSRNRVPSALLPCARNRAAPRQRGRGSRQIGSVPPAGSNPCASLCASDTPLTAPFSGFERFETKPRKRLQQAVFACSSRRRLPESNRCKRLCRPLRNHSAKAPRMSDYRLAMRDSRPRFARDRRFTLQRIGAAAHSCPSKCSIELPQMVSPRA
jgi:hypothetical protein